MNHQTQEFLSNIVEDRNLLRKKMIWEAGGTSLAALSAFMFASAGERANVDRYVECKHYLKKHVNVFSEIRGIAEAIVITKMCMAYDYAEYMEGVVTVYKKLRKAHKFTASPYMVLAAINIYEAGGLALADENIEKLDTIYKRMKADHFWLTGDEDRPFISMLVSRGVNMDVIAAEIDACYEACKHMSFSKEAMHTASQIMSISGRSLSDKVDDLDATIRALKEYQVKGFKADLMPMAAALGLVEGSPEVKASEIKEIYEYLRTQKGFGWLISRTERSMFSILAYAVMNLDSEKAVLNSVISASITNIIIDSITTALIVSSTVHSSSSNSGSSGN